MTQPVYDADVMRRFLADVSALPRPVPVLLGLCPLVSSRNADFLHNEVLPIGGRERPRRVLPILAQ